MSGTEVSVVILLATFAGLLYALFQAWWTTNQGKTSSPAEYEPMLRATHEAAVPPERRAKLLEISSSIASGAKAFLFKEYTWISVFIVSFALLIGIVLGFGTKHWDAGVFAAIAFVVGCVTSVLCGYIGMSIAVVSNWRTSILCAEKGIGSGFELAFRAGCVMGFTLVSAGLLILYILINIYKYSHYTHVFEDEEMTHAMFEAVAGYGLGGSSIAMFGRVGGGIYTKAADVGADLVGKVEEDLKEDDPSNPAVIADNVGDNVGDIAGMGSDLFGSLAEATCACLVVGSQSATLWHSYTYICFPLLITATGIICSILTSLVSIYVYRVHDDDSLANYQRVEQTLRLQIIVSTVLATPAMFLICILGLPNSFDLPGMTDVKYWHVFFAIIAGLWTGFFIGYTTDYYTSQEYRPTQEVAEATETGPATVVIFGLAVGYKSTVIPVICMSVTVYLAFSLCGMYGIAVSALGILSTLAIGLTIDAFGPISDNAGGVTEMAELGDEVRARTDRLDMAGNTTAAVGKGFAISSAAMVSLALFGGFVTAEGLFLDGVNVLRPFVFAGLLIGAMLPYWFSAMTMKSVGMAAKDMVLEVRRQYREERRLKAKDPNAEYKKQPERCVAISTNASLREMIAPGCLVMITPLLAGFFLGTECLSGILAGGMASGVQMAISSCNTGGSWDNAKKFISSNRLMLPNPRLVEARLDSDMKISDTTIQNEPELINVPKKSEQGKECHKAAVVGDTVGDPMKDTSGPSLNILMKLMAVEALVFAPAIPKIGLLVQLFGGS